MVKFWQTLNLLNLWTDHFKSFFNQGNNNRSYLFPGLGKEIGTLSWNELGYSLRRERSFNAPT